MDLSHLKAIPGKKEHQEVVRVSTSYWHDNKGIYLRKSIIPQKRKSFGSQLLIEDSRMAGADSVFGNIINLHDCKDGLYEVVMCNPSTDWETGYVDEYDYKLVPFTP